MIGRFIHTNPIEIAPGEYYDAEVVLEKLAPLLTPERWAKIQKVVAGRTSDVVPVLENIYDRGNTSAVFRSAEAMGFQIAHVISSA